MHLKVRIPTRMYTGERRIEMLHPLWAMLRNWMYEFKARRNTPR